MEKAPKHTHTKKKKKKNYILKCNNHKHFITD